MRNTKPSQRPANIFTSFSTDHCQNQLRKVPISARQRVSDKSPNDRWDFETWRGLVRAHQHRYSRNSTFDLLSMTYTRSFAIDDHRLRVYARFLKPTTGKITVGYHLLTTRSLPIGTKSGSPKERNQPRPTETISFPSSFSERDRQFYLG